MGWSRATCPSCNGGGRVGVHVLRRGWLRDYYVVETASCPGCGGTGSVAVQTAGPSFATSVASNVVAGALVAVVAPAACTIV